MFKATLINPFLESALGFLKQELTPRSSVGSCAWKRRVQHRERSMLPSALQEMQKEL